jgi:hypothetical protein
VYGLTFVGSPASQRSIQFDERRVADLQQITFGVDEYWEQNEVLPEELQDLQDVRAFVRSIADPKTGEPYEYRIVEERTYELCAVFENDSSAMQEKLPKKPFSEQSWDHGVGHTCFEHEAQEFTKELVPVPAR